MIHPGNSPVLTQKYGFHAAIILTAKAALILLIMLCCRRMYQVEQQKIAAEGNKLHKVSAAPRRLNAFFRQTVRNMIPSFITTDDAVHPFFLLLHNLPNLIHRAKTINLNQMGQLPMCAQQLQGLQNLFGYFIDGCLLSIGQSQRCIVAVAMVQINQLRSGRFCKLQVKGQLTNIDFRKIQ